MKKLCTIIGLFAFLLCVFTGCTSTSNSPKSGEDYELSVWEAFWETTSASLGLEYSDYKMAHTAYSFVSESETSDGYKAYYYLIQTAYETENVFGKEVLHPITARCYYVPEYSNVVYTTYMTIDGETVLFDEETENWLLDIGGGSAPKKTEAQESAQKPELEAEEDVLKVEPKTTESEASENSVGIEKPSEKNSIDDLTYIVNGVCDNYNGGNTPYDGKLHAVVNNGTSITITHNIPNTLSFEEQDKVNEMENVIKRLFSQTLNSEFPEHININVETSVMFSSSAGIDFDWNNDFSTDEIAE